MLIILALTTSFEVCQSFLRQDVLQSFQDILLGLAGELLVLIWKDADQRAHNRPFFWRLMGVGGIAICTTPLLLMIMNEYRARRNFPMLSDFESFLDTSRWGRKAQTLRGKNPVKNGQFALRVPLTTDKYCEISLNYCPENSSNAKELTFSIYNPGEQLTLYYRVYDWKHRGKKDYSDKYKGHSELVSGWNTIKVEIKKI